jgi:hypothetical protein
MKKKDLEYIGKNKKIYRRVIQEAKRRDWLFFLWHSFFKLSTPPLDWNQVLFPNKMVFLSSASINFISNRRITASLHIL